MLNQTIHKQERISEICVKCICPLVYKRLECVDLKKKNRKQIYDQIKRRYNRRRQKFAKMCVKQKFNLKSCKFIENLSLLTKFMQLHTIYLISYRILLLTMNVFSITCFQELSIFYFLFLKIRKHCLQPAFFLLL